MKSFLKYLFVCISLYLMLDFAANNPEKVSVAKDFVDSNLENMAKAVQNCCN